MKKTYLPTTLRWSVFLSLLVFMTGCAGWNFFGGSSSHPLSERGGCFGSERTVVTTNAFGPHGYELIMGHQPGAYGIAPRDMGFAVDERHYIPIIRERSSS